MRPMRRAVLPIAIAASTVALGGCFTTSADFADDAEEYIGSTVAIELGVSFESVECLPPESQDVGTVFECTAIDDDGGAWTFDTKITEKNEITVTLDRSP